MATAKAKTTLTTTEAWEVRAVELAFERGLADRVEYDHCGYAGEDPDGHGFGRYEMYWVRAQAQAQAESERHAAHSDHLVRFDEAARTVRCDCTAASYGRPCAHVGAVIVLLAMRNAAIIAWLRATGNGGEAA